MSLALSPLDRELLSHARSLLGYRLDGPPGPEELRAHAQRLLSLQRGLTAKRERIGTPYMDERDSLAAYLLFYWQVSYAQAGGLFDMMQRALKEPILPPISSTPDPLRLLDLGCGPGPAGIALAERLGGSPVRQTPNAGIRIDFCDTSALAADIACKLAQARGFMSKATAPWRAGKDPLPSGPYDIIVLSMLLNEIDTAQSGRHESREAILMAACDQLAPKGLLFILEPALLETSRELLVLRDRLAKRGWQPLAPCFTPAPCPALAEENQSCHSEFPAPSSPLMAELSRRTGLDKSLVKACAFVFAAVQEAPEQQEAWRVVSEQRLNKAGRSRVSLCGGDPDPRRISLSTKGPLVANRFIQSAGPGHAAQEKGQARKAESPHTLSRSDQIQVNNYEERPTGWGIGPQTSITLFE